MTRHLRSLKLSTSMILVVSLACSVLLLSGPFWAKAMMAAPPPDLSACSIIVSPLKEPATVARDARRLARIQDAVNNAEPGAVICVSSRDHGNERITVSQSGTKDAPIQIRAIGKVNTAGFVVKADYVTISGFTVSNRGRGDEDGRRMGIYIAGTGLQVLNNTVIDTDGDGIGCETYPPRCLNTLIAHNIVRGADGTGIVVAGRRILIERNDISRSVRIEASDADGIRFFGSDITVRRNYVHDISDRGYPKDENPHTDCFQTFDKDKPATTNVVIENNICDNVDHQCLIAEALIKGQSSGIKFRNNICKNNGSQGILIRGFPSVEVTNNLFLPSIKYFGVVLRSGAAAGTVMNNAFVGKFQPYTVDQTSTVGFKADYNLVYDATQRVPPKWWGWAEPHGIVGKDPKFVGSTKDGRFSAYRPAPGSPLVDAGNSAYNDAPTDLAGNPRVVDGDGNGTAEIDIGPYEFTGQP